MTNSEKFKEVFGFYPDSKVCVLPQAKCMEIFKIGEVKTCDECPFKNFFGKEYKDCFEMDDRK